MATELEKFLQHPTKREELLKLVEGRVLGDAIEVLKDMHRPSRGNVTARDASRVVLAAETHDYQAGWHDCIRALRALTIPKKEQTQKTLEPFDDEWVKTLMEKRGTPLREATERKPPNSAKK